MNSTIDESRRLVEPAAVRAWAQGRIIYLELHDGRIVGFPADRFRILALATEAYDAYWLVYPPEHRDWPPLLALREWLQSELQTAASLLAQARLLAT